MPLSRELVHGRGIDNLYWHQGGVGAGGGGLEDFSLLLNTTVAIEYGLLLNTAPNPPDYTLELNTDTD